MIGNGAYTHVKALPNPPNDARAIAKSLGDIGFAVSAGIDLDRVAMQKMTRDFLREAARAQVCRERDGRCIEAGGEMESGRGHGPDCRGGGGPWRASSFEARFGPA